MPPLPLEYVGHEPIAAFLDDRANVRGALLQLRRTRANGQPAFGCYLHSRAWGVLALTLSGEQIAELTFFSGPSLLGRFGLPRQILCVGHCATSVSSKERLTASRGASGNADIRVRAKPAGQRRGVVPGALRGLGSSLGRYRPRR